MCILAKMNYDVTVSEQTKYTAYLTPVGELRHVLSMGITLEQRWFTNKD